MANPKPHLSTSVVILIGKARIQAVVVSSDRSPSHVLDRDWTSDNLATLFLEVKQLSHQSQFYVLIGDDLYFLTSLVLKPQDPSDPQDLERLAETVLPYPADKLGIDFQSMSHDQTHSIYQLLAIKKELLSLIGRSAHQANVHILAVKPVVSALLNSLAKPTQSFILIWEDSRFNLALIHQNQVYMVLRSEESDIYNQLDSLLSWCQHHLNLSVTSIFMSKTTTLDKTKLKAKKFKLHEQDLDPFTNNEVFGFDQTLEEPPLEVFPEEESPVPAQTVDEKDHQSSIISETISAPKPPLKLIEKEKSVDTISSQPSVGKSNARFFAIIITILAVLVGLVVGGFLVYQNAINEDGRNPQIIESDTPPSSSPSPTPSDNQATNSAQIDQNSPDEIDKSQIKVSVLNGSGVPGLAGKVKDLLSEADFENIDTGNADSFDFTTTQIQVKTNNTALYSAIKLALESDYSLTQGDPLDSDSDYDAVITVGKE